MIKNTVEGWHRKANPLQQLTYFRCEPQSIQKIWLSVSLHPSIYQSWKSTNLQTK